MRDSHYSSPYDAPDSIPDSARPKTVRRLPWAADIAVRLTVAETRGISGSRLLHVWDAGGAYLGLIESFKGQTERPIRKGSRIVTRGKPHTCWAFASGGVHPRAAAYRMLLPSQADAIRKLLPEF